MSKKKHLRILAVLFAMVLTLCMAPMTTYAATKAVTVSAKSQSMYVGTKNKSLGVKVTKGAKVTYKSSSPSIVTVSSSGKVTAKKAGTAKITIKASKKGYKTTSKVITVKAVRRKNSITASNKTVYLGKTASVGAKAKTGLTYKSSNTGIVTVDSKGILRGKKAGTATITITAKASTIYGSATKKITVTVKKAPSKATQKITASNKSVYVGKTASIGAKAKTTLTYKSSNTGIVTVSSKGTLKGIAPGKAKVTIIAAESSKYKSAKVIVEITVKKKPVEVISEERIHHEAVTHIEKVVVSEAWDETIHHDAIGHTETVVISEAWDEEVPVYETRPIPGKNYCNTCGAELSSTNYEELDKHFSDSLDRWFAGEISADEVCNGWHGTIIGEKEVQVGTEIKHHDAVTEEQFIEDTPAWDETVNHPAVTEEQTITDTPAYDEIIRTYSDGSTKTEKVDCIH